MGQVSTFHKWYYYPIILVVLKLWFVTLLLGAYNLRKCQKFGFTLRSVNCNGQVTRLSQCGMNNGKVTRLSQCRLNNGKVTRLSQCRQNNGEVTRLSQVKQNVQQNRNSKLIFIFFHFTSLYQITVWNSAPHYHYITIRLPLDYHYITIRLPLD